MGPDQQATGVTAVALDFDGTFADTMPALTAAAVAVMCMHYGTSPGEALRSYTATMGAPFEVQLAEIYGDINDAAVKEFNDRKRIALHDAIAFPEAIAFALSCRKMGLQLGLVSSTEQGLLRSFLEKRNYESLFNIVLGLGNGPKDVQLFRWAYTLSVAPQRVLFIGDAVRDSEYAKKAGTQFTLLKGEEWESITKQLT